MQNDTTPASASHVAATDVTRSQELADEYGITFRDDLTVELRRPAWCDTDEKWSRYRAEIEAAWPEVMKTAIARAQGRQL